MKIVEASRINKVRSHYNRARVENVEVRSKAAQLRIGQAIEIVDNSSVNFMRVFCSCVNVARDAENDPRFLHVVTDHDGQVYCECQDRNLR